MKYYLVGGAVRDQLLGLPIKDRDWVVVGETPESLKQKGFQQVGNDFPVFIHPKTKEEYALARTERKQGHGYTGFICDFSPQISLEEDLIRRDLTINAIAQDELGNLIDPFNGINDLNKKVLRHVSNAFSDDPLRVLRVARFLARFFCLGFVIAPETLNLMQSMVAKKELNYLTAERVWLETKKALESKNPEQYFLTLQSIDALPVIFPELADYLKHMEKYHLNNLLGNITDIIPSIPVRLSQISLIRFAKLFYSLSLDSIKHLCKRLNLPKDFLKLTLHCSQYAHLFKNAFNLSSTEIVTLFTKLDLWRNKENINLIRQVFGELYIKEGSFLWECYQIALKEDVQSVINDGFQKAEITQELNLRRAKKIEIYLANTNQLLE